MSITGQVLGFDGDFLRLRVDGYEVSLRYDPEDCSGQMCPDPEDFVPTLRLSGSARMSKLLIPALVEGYALDAGFRAVHRDVSDKLQEIDVEDSATGAPIMRFALRTEPADRAFDDLFANRTDVVLSSREVRSDEARLAAEMGFGRLTDAAQGEILALDALVAVVSPTRRRVHLSPDQVARMLSGELRDWADVGADPGPITVHLPKQGHEVFDGVMTRLLKPRAALPSEQLIFHETEEELSAAVAGSANAIGIVGRGHAATAQPIALGGPCGIEARSDLRALKTGDYPLTQPLFLYRPLRRSAPEVEGWLAWLRSVDAQRIVRRSGFVDQAAVPIPMAEQGDRLRRAIAQTQGAEGLVDLQRMLDRLDGAERLSITFRFKPGSTRLDAQSRANMLHLARALDDGAYRGAALTLIGFSDGQGAASANLALSLARAENVRRGLLRALDGQFPGGVSLEVEAFGEALPLSCDDTEAGRQSNRRVELWVRR